MKTLFTVLCAIPFILMAQPNDKEFAAALREARQTEKLLLVAHFDTKAQQSDNKIFGNRHVDKLFDEAFVVHQSVGDGGERAVYPLFVIYNDAGTEIHRVAGEEYPYEFIVKIKKALQPETAYATLVARFEQGDRDAAFLEALLESADHAADMIRAPRFMEAYIDACAGNYTPENFNRIVRYTRSSDNPGFSLLLDYLTDAPTAMAETAVVNRVADIIFQEMFLPNLGKNKTDVQAIVATAQEHYPQLALRNSIAKMELELLERREDWDALATAIPAYMLEYGDSITAQQAAYYAWLMEENTVAEEGLLAKHQ